MNKIDKSQIRIVLNELEDRIPESNKKGFMPEQKVINAIEYLNGIVGKDSEIDKTSNVDEWEIGE